MKHLIIAGANRSGTTFLFENLSSHDKILGSSVKQTNYFLSDYYRRNGSFNSSRSNDCDQYIDNFELNNQPKNRYDYLLEATPDYLYDRQAALKIKNYMKLTGLECVIFFILRDPIERLFSWYKYGKQLGRVEQKMIFDDYIKLQREDEGFNGHMVWTAKESGRYLNYLDRYKDMLDANMIYLISFKQLRDNTEELMSRILTELNLGTDLLSSNTDMKKNASHQTRSRMLVVYARLIKDIMGYNARKSKHNAVVNALRSIYHTINKISSTDNLEEVGCNYDELYEYYKKEMNLLNIVDDLYITNYE